MTVLPPPTFPPAATVAATSPAVFKEVSSEPNSSTDVEQWLARHELRPPRRDGQAELEAAFDELDGVAGARLGPGASLLEVGGDAKILISGYFREDDTFIAAFDPASGAFRYGFDFESYSVPPVENGVAVDVEMHAQEPVWAIEKDGILYVAHRHRGYAKDSAGKNGYVTAIDVERKAVLWRSPSLVANAETFVLLDDYLVTGYGFTAEQDYLYLLRRSDGTIVGRARLKTAPEILAEKDGLIYVRCYDTDAIFRLIAEQSCSRRS